MKDELLEFEPDASSRKTATDWLMKVISGKKPINFHLNGSDRSEGEASDHAVAVEEPPAAPEPASPKRAGWAEVKRETVAAEFTAEDLCGAPAVPVIRVVPSPGDAITADDVCWVPVEKRLKPEPVAAPKQPEPLAPKLKIVAQQEVPLAEARAPKTAEPSITAEDISREPAPYMVEPMRGGFAVEFDAPDAEQEITAADIAREWTLREMSPAPRETRNGTVLPLSFKVIQSPGAGPDTAETPEKKEDESPALAEAVATAPIETVPVAAAPEMVSAEAAGIAEQAAPVAEPQLEVPDAQARVEIATEIVAEMPEAIASGSSNATAVEAPEAVAAEPVVEPAEVAVEVAPEVVAAEPVEMAEPGVEMPASEEALEESAAEAEIETALHDAEVSGPAEAEQSVAESAFAHEGFWGAAAGGEGAAQGEAIYEKPVLQKMKRPRPSPEEMAEMGQRPEGWITAWKTLLRLGSVLPWVARALPMIEAGGFGEPQAGSAGLSEQPVVPGGLQEMRQDISGLRLVQYEIRTTVQDHSMQLKRMEEQLGRVRESMEAKGSQTGELAESLRSMTRLVRFASMGLGGLLLVLVVLMIVMLAHGR